MPSSRSESVTVRGCIEAVFYAGPQFSAGRLLDKSGEQIAFAGRLFAREGESIVLNGHWSNHPKYGRQLQVENVEYDLELDPEGLANYLTKHPDMKGIGPAKARLIADHFGKDFDRAITDEPESVAKAAKLTTETARQIRAVWITTKTINKIGTRLAAFGLTHHQIISLADKFGNDALGLVETDPYRLIGEIRNFGFKRVDRIARGMGIEKNDPCRIRAGIVHCVNEALDEGHCWTEFQELIDRSNFLLVMDDLESCDSIEKELNRLLDEGILTCACHDEHFLIARPEMRNMEEDLAGIFRQGYHPNPHFANPYELMTSVWRREPDLNTAQRQGVGAALRFSISLISGAAGSGKSFTISAIARVYKDHNLKVVLAAPTGKAAKRMEQLVGCPASTIHRLLGFNGKSFARGPSNPIDADIVIIDETSMVDVALAWHLFRALDLNNTAVVMVGDHNQLPPVGPGNIVRDLIRTRAIPTVILDQVFRQAGALKENCMAVLKGEVHKTSEPAGNLTPLPWYLFDRFSEQVEARKFILELFECDLADRLGFDLISDVQLLTPTHNGLLGTHDLNAALQRVVQKKLWNVDVPPPLPGRNPKFLLHDKVIQTRNNYETGVMNGAMGVVWEVLSEGLIVNFDGEFVKVQGEELQDIRLAYCLTTHKCQGSEFPCAIVVVHKAHSFMHHRNLFYTGVTRAQQTAIIVGDHWGIQNCAAKRKQDERRTLLSFLLRNSGKNHHAIPR